jgi:protein TonB
MSQSVMTSKPQAAVACFAVLCALHGAAFSLADFFAATQKIPAKKEMPLLVFEFEAPVPHEEPAVEEPQKTAPASAEPAGLAKIAEAVAEVFQEPLPLTEVPSGEVPAETPETVAEAGQEPQPMIAADTAVPIEPASVVAEAVVEQVYAPRQTSHRMSENDYIALIMRRLEEKKVYPLAMRKRGIEGDMPVRFTIRADGTLAQVTAEDSRAHPFLVQAALETVKSASPFPVREGMSGDFSVRVTIRYELK